MLAAALCLGTGACGVIGPPEGPCLPEPLQLSSDQVRVGDELTVSSAAFTCDARYPPGHRYELTLSFIRRADPIPLGGVPVNPDGSFTATVRMPENAPPGTSHIAVEGSRYETECRDGESCAGYSVELTLLPSS